MAQFERVNRSFRSDDESRFVQATKREFQGQWHTFSGERGKQLLCGLQMRDVADAVVTALHRVDAEHCDFDAVAQDVCILLEHALGIYPNIAPNVR